MKITAKANKNSIQALNILSKILTKKDAVLSTDYDGRKIATIGFRRENLEFTNVINAVKSLGVTDSEITDLKSALFYANGSEKNYVCKTICVNGFYVYFETAKTKFTAADRNKIQRDVAEMSALSCFDLHADLNGAVKVSLTKAGCILVEGGRGYAKEYEFQSHYCPISGHMNVTSGILVRTDGK